MLTIRKGNISTGTPYTIFLVEGEIKDLSERAVKRDSHGRCIRYHIIDTNQTLWVTHGYPNGTIVNEVFISVVGKPNDWVVACHPKCCAKENPDLNFVAAYCDGNVTTQLVGKHGTGIGALLVTEASVGETERKEVTDAGFEMIVEYLERGQ